MKEIIYLDTELMNSYLAQLDSGVQQKIINSITDQSSHDEKKYKSHETSGGLGISNTNVQHTRKSSETVSDSIGKSGSTSEEVILHDAALELLIMNLEADNLISKTYEDGKIIRETSDFEINDFELLKNVSSKDALKHIYSGDYESSPYYDAYKISCFGAELFPDSCLFKFKGIVSICSNKYFRIEKSLISLLNGTTRDMTILGIVTSKKVLTEAEQNKNKEPNVLNLLVDIFFSEQIYKGVKDVFVRPIALYFDSSDD
ncbi:hypothetical protein [Dolosigranulum savutiense]|uniref:Uncharacterized protein n=1 Tax=Dolosigranulum savutiense TaxID=3110288 RepID=A0AB74TP07_9LACT